MTEINRFSRRVARYMMVIGAGTFALLTLPPAAAQEDSEAFAPAGLASPVAQPAEQLDATPSTTTVITAEEEATFSSASREATFTGNVRVTDPQFRLTCDRLIAYLGEEEGAGDTGSGAGALRKAVAEGNVVVTQTREREGSDPVTYIGKAQKGVYDAGSGDFELSGWPEVQQGINTHVATEAGTVMIITREGQMKTRGGSRTMIQETTADER